ncbi:MAG TPA: NYN domain-containing protein [Ktedonobacterales bacterium]|jgi:predicted RNA-binding protein with PIN domain
MRSRVILVDGYNVIRHAPELLAAERRSLASGREALLAQIRATYQSATHRVIVVFDGDGPAETRSPLAGLARGQVIYTARSVTADAVIVRLAAEERLLADDVVVVTRDADLRHHASEHGAASAHPDELRTKLHEAPRDVAQRARHRAAIRRVWDKDADGDDERPAPDRRRGNPRKAPRRRRAQRDDYL